MDTIKTAFVVALLLAVLYGVYVVLNKEPASTPNEVADMLQEADEDGILDNGPQIESGSVADTKAEEKTPAEHEFHEPSVSSEVPMPSESTDPLPQTAGHTAPINPRRGSQYVEPQLPAPDSPSTDQPSTKEPDFSQGGYDPGSSASPADPNTTDAPDSANQAPSTPGSTTNQGSSAQPEGSANNSEPATSSAFAELWKKAQEEVEQNKFPEALVTATTAYTSQLDDQQRDQLQDFLDPLAAKVIYSREPLLLPSYTARGDETLADIATTYNVPWQLLQNINGIENPEILLAGTTLKVVKGPFRAEVNTRASEMTLYLNDMYAGRFVISVGNEPAPKPGTYWVKTKEEGHAYFTADNRTIAANDPLNPYGDVWIDLGRDNACIHGSPLKGLASPGAGCISLSPREAHDVFGILVEGSQVVVLP